MRTIFKTIFLLAMTALLVQSCKKDETRFELHNGSFETATAFTASAPAIILEPSNDNDTVLRFSWPVADFGSNEVVSYSLEFTSVGDTSAAYHWGLAKTFILGPAKTTHAFTGKEINNYLNEMGFATGTPNDIVFRVKAGVIQYNGAASSVPAVYSNAAGVDISSYAMSLYVPGDYQGWSPATAPQLAPVTGRPGLFEGFVFMEAAGQHYFKYTNAPDWNHTNYGDGGNGTFSTDGAAAGLSVPDGGYYELTANLNSNRWTAVKTSWGIIGDASPGGWNNDTPMVYDPVTQTWKVTLAMVSNGSWKFRANGSWDINFGIDNNGRLFYADNPFFGSVPLNNLTVPENGSYTITLDLHIPGHYTYTAVKN
ncbi:MAG: hypothetical protein EOO09_09275 [Chitinophagaceae bacterium]|nr:MAG: hypothetical protein EOO09_09275 [Chitinophagaceae bacterium]